MFLDRFRDKIAAAVLGLALFGVGFGVSKCQRYLSDRREAAYVGALGFQQAAPVTGTKQDAELISQLRKELGDKEEKLRLLVNSRARISVSGVAKEAPVEQGKEAKPASGESLDFARRCEDWQDADGRFFFDATARELTYNQRFMAQTTLITDRRGRVYARTSLAELSPLSGEVLAQFPAQEEEVRDLRSPSQASKWFLFAGYSAAVGVDDNYQHTVVADTSPLVLVGRTWGRSRLQLLAAGSLSDQRLGAVVGVSLRF